MGCAGGGEEWGGGVQFTSSKWYTKNGLRKDLLPTWGTAWPGFTWKACWVAYWLAALKAAACWAWRIGLSKTIHHHPYTVTISYVWSVITNGRTCWVKGFLPPASPAAAACWLLKPASPSIWARVKRMRIDKGSCLINNDNKIHDKESNMHLGICSAILLHLVCSRYHCWHTQGALLCFAGTHRGLLGVLWQPVSKWNSRVLLKIKIYRNVLEFTQNSANTTPLSSTSINTELLSIRNASLTDFIVWKTQTPIQDLH